VPRPADVSSYYPPGPFAPGCSSDSRPSPHQAPQTTAKKLPQNNAWMLRIEARVVAVRESAQVAPLLQAVHRRIDAFHARLDLQ